MAREETLTDPEHPAGVNPIRSFSFDLLTGAVTELGFDTGPRPTAAPDPANRERFARTHLLQPNSASLDAGARSP